MGYMIKMLCLALAVYVVKANDTIRPHEINGKETPTNSGPAQPGAAPVEEPDENPPTPASTVVAKKAPVVAVKKPKRNWRTVLQMLANLYRLVKKQYAKVATHVHAPVQTLLVDQGSRFILPSRHAQQVRVAKANNVIPAYYSQKIRANRHSPAAFYEKV